jgi:hypothetical protein
MCNIFFIFYIYTYAHLRGSLWLKRVLYITYFITHTYTNSHTLTHTGHALHQ